MSLDRTAITRLSDLRRAQPADATLRNLLGVLTAKLEMFGQLPVYEYEAGVEGYKACAAAFRRLAEDEQRTFYALLATLRTHLNETSYADQEPGAEADAPSEGRFTSKEVSA